MKDLYTPAPTEPLNNNFDFLLLCNETRSGRKDLVWRDLDNIFGDINDSSGRQEQASAIWLVLSFLIVAGNVSVIAWRLLSKKEQRNSIPSILIINLAVADFLFGIHFLIYALMSGHILCSAWVSPNYIPLMKSLCIICGFLETTCTYASVMVGFTIALYYANVVFGSCSRRFSRRCVTIFLCTEWLIAVVVATCWVILTLNRRKFSLYRVTNHLASDNSTFSIIMPQNCLSVASLFIFSQILLYAYIAITGCLTLMTAGTYIGIAIKLLYLRITKSSSTTRVGGLGLRLVFIALIALMGWLAAIFLILFEFFLEAMLPFAFAALSNPLIFTLTSQPFLNAVKKFKQAACFKIGRPTPIEDVTNDSESLLPTRLPPSDTV